MTTNNPTPLDMAWSEQVGARVVVIHGMMETTYVEVVTIAKVTAATVALNNGMKFQRKHVADGPALLHVPKSRRYEDYLFLTRPDHPRAVRFLAELVTGTQADGMRNFRLRRDQDGTGYSGTGFVVDGCVFPDGQSVMRWKPRPGKVQSTEIFDTVDELMDVHGHHGDTRLVWTVGCRCETEEAAIEA